MMKIVLSTRNPGKVKEMRALLEGLPIELIPASDLPDAPEVEEDGATLQDNAQKKAEVLAAHTGLPALADDTGLEVTALAGRPGVHSARFAGPEADDAANRQKLLQALAGARDRSARFRTVIAFAEGGQLRFFEGVCPGRILEEERGTGGFGYDALFAPEGRPRTFAEMPEVEKNELSHRGRALRSFARYLRERLST